MNAFRFLAVLGSLAWAGCNAALDLEAPRRRPDAISSDAGVDGRVVNQVEDGGGRRDGDATVVVEARAPVDAAGDGSGERNGDGAGMVPDGGNACVIGSSNVGACVLH